MMKFAVAFMLVAAPASAQNLTLDLPIYDVDGLCHRFAPNSQMAQSGCVTTEQSAYEGLRAGTYSPNGVVFSWDDLPPKVKSSCAGQVSDQIANHSTYFPYTALQACSTIGAERDLATKAAPATKFRP